MPSTHVKGSKISKRVTEMKSSSTSSKVEPNNSGSNNNKQTATMKKQHSTTAPTRRKTSHLINNNKEKNNFKLTKIPDNVVSKWPRLPHSVQNTIMAMLDESMSSFACSRNDIVHDTLTNIRARAQRTLSRMKAPKENWTNAASLKSAQEILTAEKARLEDLQTTLEEELRQLELENVRNGDTHGRSR